MPGENEPVAEFEPEVIQRMIDALDITFRVLRVAEVRPSDLTVLAARRIVELAEAGERDAERFRNAALKALRH